MRRNRLNEMDWDRIHDDLSKDRRLKARRVTNRVNDYMSSDQYAGIYKKVKVTNKKALYESIMKSVAKQVKKALNEDNYPTGAKYDPRAPWNQNYDDSEVLNSLDGVFYINNFYSYVFANYVKYYYASEYKIVNKLVNILKKYAGSDRAEFGYSYEQTRTVYEWENDEGIAAPVSYDTNIDYRGTFDDDLMIIDAAKDYPEYKEIFLDFANKINEYMDFSSDGIEKDEDYDKKSLVDTIIIPFEDIVDIEDLNITY